jgi:dimethylglycine dehydrogenase
MSVLSKFEVSGTDAEAFMNSLGANRAPARIGRIGLVHALTPSGGVLSEFTVTHLGEDRYYLTSAAAARRIDSDVLRDHTRRFPRVKIDERSEGIGVLAVMGPSSRDLLSRLTDEDLGNEQLPWLSGRELAIAGIPVSLLRVSYVGELGYELHHPIDQQQRLFHALMQAGLIFEVAPFGAFAMNSMRLEKAYRAWGLDFTTERTPYEAGVDALVRPCGRDFVGRKALEEHSRRPRQKRMVLFEIGGDGPDPFYSHPVFSNGKVAGIVTSGAFGHRTGLKLALAYVDPDTLAERSGQFTVEIVGEPSPARVLPRTPYDPDNLRLKS